MKNIIRRLYKLFFLNNSKKIADDVCDVNDLVEVSAFSVLRKRISELEAPSSKETFENAIGFARGLHSKESVGIAIKCIAKRIQNQLILNLIFKGHDLSGESFSVINDLFFSKGSNPVEEMRKKHGDMVSSFDINEYIYKHCRIAKNTKINLNDTVVFSCPWKVDRLKNAFSNIGSVHNNDWKQDDRNHQVELWYPLNIGWVSGGNHSLSVGIIQSEGSLMLDEYYDLTSLYDLVYCDGNHFIEKESEKLICPVVNYDLATIFELGRRYVELAKMQASQ